MQIDTLKAIGWTENHNLNFPASSNSNTFEHDWFNLNHLVNRPAKSHYSWVIKVLTEKIVREHKTLSASTKWDSRRFEIKLANVFEEIPFEDGFFHPAEQILDEAIGSSHKREVLDWLLQTITNKKASFFSLSVLRSLAHLKPATTEWRSKIIKSALTSSDIETRDVAVQVAETWDDIEIKDILKKHKEPIPWLKSYINEVIDNLGK